MGVYKNRKSHHWHRKLGALCPRVLIKLQPRMPTIFWSANLSALNAWGAYPCCYVGSTVHISSVSVFPSEPTKSMMHVYTHINVQAWHAALDTMIAPTIWILFSVWEDPPKNVKKVEELLKQPLSILLESSEHILCLDGFTMRGFRYTSLWLTRFPQGGAPTN